LLQRKLEFSSAREPAAMDSIASAVNVAAPDTLEAEQNITAKLRPNLLQFIGKPNYRSRAQARDRPKWPLVLGPFLRCDKLDVVSGFYDSARKSS